MPSFNSFSVCQCCLMTKLNIILLYACIPVNVPCFTFVCMSIQSDDKNYFSPQ